MATNIKRAGVAVSASTSSAQGTLPAGLQDKYIRVVNGSTSLAYVTAGSNPTATNANIAVGPSSTAVFERDVNTDALVAVLLATGTGTVSFSLVGTPND